MDQRYSTTAGMGGMTNATFTAGERALRAGLLHQALQPRTRHPELEVYQ